jgi:uncharacterized membrane protein YbhN (UPF0104 family)
LPALSPTPGLIGAVVTAIVISSLCMWAYGSVWWLAAGASDFAPWWTIQRIYARANVAKYIPGNVFQYVGRYQLAVGAGVDSSRTAASIALESLVMIIAAMIVVCVGYLASPTSLAFIPALVGKAHWLVVALVFVVALAWWQRAFVMSLINTLRQMVTLGRFLAAIALNICIFVAIGASVTLLDREFVPHTSIEWVDYTWGFAIAWVLGFMVPGAPGGLGVREAVLFALFAKRLGPGEAAMLFLIFRVVTSVADLIVFALSFLGRPLRAPSARTNP